MSGKSEDSYINDGQIHYKSEPKCGKHLTDDVMEGIEEFIYVDDISRVTCKDCLNLIKT